MQRKGGGGGGEEGREGREGDTLLKRQVSQSTKKTKKSPPRSNSKDERAIAVVSVFTWRQGITPSFQLSTRHTELHSRSVKLVPTTLSRTNLTGSQLTAKTSLYPLKGELHPVR